MTRRTRVVGILAATVMGLAPAVAPAHAQPSSVTVSTSDVQWETKLPSWVENSATLPDGTILVSNMGGNALVRINPTTGEQTTVAQLDAPAGIVVQGNIAYVMTGSSPASIATNAGGMAKVNLDTGEVTQLFRGLGVANGLAEMPDGSLVFTVTLGINNAGVYRTQPGNPAAYTRIADNLDTVNGIDVGPDGNIYVGSMAIGVLTRIDPDTGEQTRVARGLYTIDDFTFLPDGRIAAATTLGSIRIIDPATGQATSLPDTMAAPTSVKPANDGTYIVTTALGFVRRLSIPAA